MADRKRRKRRGSMPRRGGMQGRHYVADGPVGEAGALNATVRSPTTKGGLPVEEQIRKEWDSKIKGGLSTSLRVRAR